MNNRLYTTLSQLSIEARPADLLDIGVIAVLLYLGLMWIRRRTSHSLVLAVGALALLYVTANRWDMVLTSRLFQLGFTAALLALIVVFQHDIRRGFERMASWSIIPRKRSPRGASSEVDTLSEAVAGLAQDRIGALLVFKGREPIERHVRGGVRVDGEISLPLLYSIFHPGTPGHDGAVVLENRRIERLGVHLPLSKNLAEIGRGGTRHAAALGLCERSDALVIVVSEERGTISIAEHGCLTEIQPAQLKPLLEQQQRCGPTPRTRSLSLLTRNIGWKAASLLLATALWILLAYQAETVQRTYVVPIEYRNVPEGYVIEELGTKHSEVAISGTKRAFDLFDARTLVVSADVGDVKPDSSQFVSTAGPTDLPAGLTVTGIEPGQVPIVLKASSARESEK